MSVPDLMSLVVLVDNDTAVDNLARMAGGMGWASRTEVTKEGGFRVSLRRRGAAEFPPPKFDQDVVDALTPVRLDAAKPTVRDVSASDAPVSEVTGAPESNAKSAASGTGDLPTVPEIEPARMPQKRDGVKRVAVLVTADTLGRGDAVLGQLLMRAFLKTLKEVDPLPSDLMFLNAGVRFACEGSEILQELVVLQERGARLLCCGTCLEALGLTKKLRVGSISNMHEITQTCVDADQVLSP